MPGLNTILKRFLRDHKLRRIVNVGLRRQRVLIGFYLQVAHLVKCRIWVIKCHSSNRHVAFWRSSFQGFKSEYRLIHRVFAHKLILRFLFEVCPYVFIVNDVLYLQCVKFVLLTGLLFNLDWVNYF